MHGDGSLTAEWMEVEGGKNNRASMCGCLLSSELVWEQDSGTNREGFCLRIKQKNE